MPLPATKTRVVSGFILDSEAPNTRKESEFDLDAELAAVTTDAGLVAGPVSSVAGNVPQFVGVDGDEIADSGKAAADLIAAPGNKISLPRTSSAPTYGFDSSGAAADVHAGLGCANGVAGIYAANAGGSAPKLVANFVESGVQCGSSGFWRLRTVDATATVPNICPEGVFDDNTGLGHAGADQLSLIAGGVETVRITTTAAQLLGGLRMVGYKSSAADPTTTEFPTDKDCGIHKNTSSGAVFLAYNDGGVIKKVTLS